MKQKHFTCTDCGSESEQPGVCHDSDCVKEGMELTECQCTDGEHGGEYEESHYSRG